MRMLKNDSGFTIIELLVVTSIIGVLAAIALPGYAEYRGDAYDKEAQSALRQIATAQEVYFLDNDSYVSCNQSNCHLLLDNVQPIAAGVNLEIVSVGLQFTGTASHNKGTGEIFTWSG